MTNKTVRKMSKGDPGAYNLIRDYFQARIHRYMKFTLATHEHSEEITEYIFNCLAEARNRITSVRQLKRHLASALMAYATACKKAVLVRADSEVIFETLMEKYPEVKNYDEPTKEIFRIRIAFFRGHITDYQLAWKGVAVSPLFVRDYIHLTLAATSNKFRELWPPPDTELRYN